MPNAVYFELYLDLQSSVRQGSALKSQGANTIQFVAVIGIRENSHPDCAWRSDVSRMYL